MRNQPTGRQVRWAASPGKPVPLVIALHGIESGPETHEGRHEALTREGVLFLKKWLQNDQ